MALLVLVGLDFVCSVCDWDDLYIVLMTVAGGWKRKIGLLCRRLLLRCALWRLWMKDVLVPWLIRFLVCLIRILLLSCLLCVGLLTCVRLED